MDPSSTPPKILIADDNPQNVELLEAYLGDFACEIHTAHDGEETLKAVANMTRGEYFHAGSATDLKKVYELLNARIIFEKKEMEITAFFSAAAAALALLAAGLSMLWFNRIL